MGLDNTRLLASGNGNGAETGKSTETMLKLIDGEKPRRVYGSSHQQLDREMHTAFTQLEGGDGTVPSEAIYEVRRGRQKPWRYLARRLREAREADVPIEQAKEIVRVLDLYVDRLYNRPGGTAA